MVEKETSPLRIIFLLKKFKVPFEGYFDYEKLDVSWFDYGELSSVFCE